MGKRESERVYRRGREGGGEQWKESARACTLAREGGREGGSEGASERGREGERGKRERERERDREEREREMHYIGTITFHDELWPFWRSTFFCSLYYLYYMISYIYILSL